MKREKILIFSDCYIYGGSEKLMAFLLKNPILKENFDLNFAYRKHKEYEAGLKNEGLYGKKNIYPVFLLSNETLFHKINGYKLNRPLKMGMKVPFFLLEMFRFYFLWNVLMLIILLFRTKPDLIHINNGGYPAAKSCNIMVVANYLSIKAKVVYQVNNQAREVKGYLERQYDRFIHNHVNCFINASHMAKKQLVERRKFDPNKILIVNNSVPLPKIKKNKSQIFSELEIAQDSFLIVEVAFLSERKGQRYLIDALANLYHTKQIGRNNVYCAFVGNGEDEEFLTNYIKKLSLSDNIFLLGYRNNSEDYIAAADLFVLPSIKDEDMPLVLLSALGYEKPIIATDFAGISQVIKTEVNGILIPNN